MKITSISLFFAVIGSAPALAAVLVGRVDDFQDGTVQGWTGGPVATIEPGGPGGPNDLYLRLDRTAYAFHVGASNKSTWTGNYLAAGVKAIAMDVFLDSSVDLSLRIMLFGPGGNFSTATPMIIPGNSGWHPVEFGLTPSDLVHVTGSVTPKAPDGPGILTDTLSHVTTLLIRHDPYLTPPGRHPQHIIGVMGLDNITAVIDPASTYDVALGLEGVSHVFYTLTSVAPGPLNAGPLQTVNPTLPLRSGQRYQITLAHWPDYPWELIAQGDSADQDLVLLSMAPDETTPFESDPDVAWNDPGTGTATFTLTPSLVAAMTAGGRQPGYRCASYPDTMRGTLSICTSNLKSDLNGDCRVDFFDLALLASQWLMDQEI